MNHEAEIARIHRFIQGQVGNRKAIIGISGGIDSAVVAYLAVGALGKENVKGILMPMNQDISSYKRAQEVVMCLDIEAEAICVEHIMQSFQDCFSGMDLLTAGNLCARIRMCILYIYANRGHGMVVGTTNKS